MSTSVGREILIKTKKEIEDFKIKYLKLTNEFTELIKKIDPTWENLKYKDVFKYLCKMLTYPCLENYKAVIGIYKTIYENLYTLKESFPDEYEVLSDLIKSNHTTGYNNICYMFLGFNPEELVCENPAKGVLDNSNIKLELEKGDFVLMVINKKILEYYEEMKELSLDLGPVSQAESNKMFRDGRDGYEYYRFIKNVKDDMYRSRNLLSSVVVLEEIKKVLHKVSGGISNVVQFIKMYSESVIIKEIDKRREELSNYMEEFFVEICSDAMDTGYLDTDVINYSLESINKATDIYLEYDRYVFIYGVLVDLINELLLGDKSK
jgi:hypothetical protein